MWVFGSYISHLETWEFIHSFIDSFYFTNFWIIIIITLGWWVSTCLYSIAYIFSNAKMAWPYHIYIHTYIHTYIHPLAHHINPLPSILLSDGSIHWSSLLWTQHCNGIASVCMSFKQFNGSLCCEWKKLKNKKLEYKQKTNESFFWSIQICDMACSCALKKFYSKINSIEKS